jgi:plastocyanin
MKKVFLGLGLFAAALVLVPGCSSDDTPGTSSSGSSGATSAATVTLSPNKFEPQTVTIKVGQSVTWKWNGGTHNVTGGTNCTPDTSANKFRSGDPQSGGTFDKKFDTAGTFDYFCEPHCSVGMTGKVIVTQ